MVGPTIDEPDAEVRAHDAEVLAFETGAVVSILFPTALCGRGLRSPRRTARTWAHNSQRDFSQLSSSPSFRHLAFRKTAEPTGGWHVAKAFSFMRSVISA